MHEGESELFDDLMELYCPKCSTKLDLIVFPTYAETMQAVADGKKVDPADIATHEYRKNLQAQWEKEKLNSPQQLPEIQGNELEFIWDKEKHELWEADYYVIIQDGKTVWREPAFYEDAPRFSEVVEIFKKKYGERFKEMAVTWAALDSLMGDKLGYWSYVKGCPIIEHDGRKRWDLTL